MPRSICVKRCHGLGNVILLLPVLDCLHAEGRRVCLVTQSKWIEALSVLRPHYRITSDAENGAVDLDELTVDVVPSRHRTDEFADLLGLGCRVGPSGLEVPSSWKRPFEHLSGSIVFAPEAAHPSRRWPGEYCNRVKGLFEGERIVVTGTDEGPAIDCDVDLRGQLDTAGLFGVIGVAAAVISMDSAVLHIAAAMRKPTVGIFGGVDYRFRVRQEQPVVAMQAKMACCPCNKRETCEGTYDCIRAMRPEDVLEAVGIAEHTDELIDYYAAEGIRR